MQTLHRLAAYAETTTNLSKQEKTSLRKTQTRERDQQRCNRKRRHQQ